MEDKLSTILANPQLMSQIMSMAQSLGQSQPATPQDAPPPPPPPQEPIMSKTGFNLSGTDGEMLRKIVSATQQTGVDRNQMGLLKALGPYLSRNRIVKLEKAMRAARIASFAAAALGSGKIFPTGR